VAVSLEGNPIVLDPMSVQASDDVADGQVLDTIYNQFVAEMEAGKVVSGDQFTYNGVRVMFGTRFIAAIQMRVITPEDEEKAAAAREAELELARNLQAGYDQEELARRAAVEEELDEIFPRVVVDGDGAPVADGLVSEHTD
jgi:hypothetical protein